MSLRFRPLPENHPLCATYFYANVALDITDKVAAATPKGCAPRNPRVEPGWAEFFHALDKAAGYVDCPCMITPNGYTCIEVEKQKCELSKAVELALFKLHGAPVPYPVPPPLFMTSDAISSSLCDLLTVPNTQSCEEVPGPDRPPCYHFGPPVHAAHPAALPWKPHSSASCCDTYPAEELKKPASCASQSRKRKAPADLF